MLFYLSVDLDGHLRAFFFSVPAQDQQDRVFWPCFVHFCEFLKVVRNVPNLPEKRLVQLSDIGVIEQDDAQSGAHLRLTPVWLRDGPVCLRNAAEASFCAVNEEFLLVTSPQLGYQ